uniref:Uncharacterized protein n=1 Tax=Cyanothece sp. (strain PCC 7425 / ATCC 29141) TaxID=395961 RepID=B8HPW3_CYAP4
MSDQLYSLWENIMRALHALELSIQYLSEAVARIFAPNHDHYPATGIIPFSGEPFKKSRWTD